MATKRARMTVERIDGGGWRWVLVGGTGEPIAASLRYYATHSAAVQGARSVLAAVKEASHWEIEG